MQTGCAKCRGPDAVLFNVWLPPCPTRIPGGVPDVVLKPRPQAKKHASDGLREHRFRPSPRFLHLSLPMRWINFLERRFGNLAIPGLIRIVVAFNALVYLLHAGPAGVRSKRSPCARSA